MRKKQIERLIRNNITAETRITWEDIEKQAGIYYKRSTKRSLPLRKVIPIAIALTLVSTITISALLVLGNRNDSISNPTDTSSTINSSVAVSEETSKDTKQNFKVSCNTDSADLPPVFEAEYGYYLYTYTGYFDKEKDEESDRARETRAYYNEICKSITGSSLDDLNTDNLVLLGESHYTYGDSKENMKLYSFKGISDQFHLVGEHNGYFGLFVYSGLAYDNEDRKEGKEPTPGDFVKLYGLKNHNDIESIIIYTEVDVAKALAEKDSYLKDKTVAKNITEEEIIKNFVKFFDDSSKKAKSFQYPDGITSSLFESKEAVLFRITLKNGLVLDICYYSAENYISIGTEFFSLGEDGISTWTDEVLK